MYVADIGCGVCRVSPASYAAGVSMSNLYYHPEEYRLEEIAAMDNGESYTFDLFIAWRHLETGRVYYSFDSG